MKRTPLRQRRTACILLTAFTFVLCQDVMGQQFPFSDVPPNHYARPAIQRLIERGIIAIPPRGQVSR